MNYFSVFFKRFNELCGNFLRVWTEMQSVENFSKNFLGQLLKTHHFSMFSKNLIIHAFVFRAFGRKTQFLGKSWENFNKNIAKYALFLDIFQNTLTNHPLIFARLDEKRKLLGNFWENFENFHWKFYWKIEFLFIFIFNFIFRKFVTKNRAFGNNTSFLQQFFRFRGGEFSPSPLATPLGDMHFNINTRCIQISRLRDRMQ